VLLQTYGIIAAADFSCKLVIRTHTTGSCSARKALREAGWTNTYYYTEKFSRLARILVLVVVLGLFGGFEDEDDLVAALPRCVTHDFFKRLDEHICRKVDSTGSC
jgi:hypothetical protein